MNNFLQACERKRKQNCKNYEGFDCQQNLITVHYFKLEYTTQLNSSQNLHLKLWQLIVGTNSQNDKLFKYRMASSVLIISTLSQFCLDWQIKIVELKDFFTSSFHLISCSLLVQQRMKDPAGPEEHLWQQTAAELFAVMSHHI